MCATSDATAALSSWEVHRAALHEVFKHWCRFFTKIQSDLKTYF